MEATICQKGLATEMEAIINAALEGTEYYFNRAGLWLETAKGLQKISNFVIFPEECITKKSERSSEWFVKVYGYATFGLLPEITLEAEQYESMSWITKNWGLSLTVELPRSKNLGHIWRVAQELGREYGKDVVMYTHMGWRRIEDSWCYLHSGGAIGDETAQVELAHDVVGYNLPDHIENCQEAVKASLRLKDVALPEISVPLLALVYLSPLNEFFKQAGHEPAFVTMLTGPTGTMKSTLAALALCHFGQFTAKSLPGSFNDTRNALEVKSSALKDTLMVVDDFYPSAYKNEYAKMASTLQGLLRSYGDRTGRARMTSDIRLREVYVPRGNLLVTGEDVPNLEQSGLARQLMLEINPGDVDKEKLSSLQGDSSLLGQAMRGYIEWLIPQADTLKDVLSEKFTAYRQQAQAGHPRLAEVVAWLRIGYEMFLDYAVSCDAMSSDRRQLMLDEALEIFTGIASRQAETMKSDTPVSQFLSALNELLASDQCHCIKLDDDGSRLGGIGNVKGRGFIGYVDSVYYYLHPDTAMAAVIDFYKRRSVHFSITKTMLLKQLSKADAIVEVVNQERVNRTPVKRIDGKNQRFIHLKKEALDKLNSPDETLGKRTRPSFLRLGRVSHYISSSSGALWRRSSISCSVASLSGMIIICFASGSLDNLSSSC